MIHADIPFASTDAKVIIRKIGHIIAKAWWNHPSSHHSLLYWLDPYLRFRIPSNVSRQLETVFYRPRLGVAHTREYRNRIGRLSTLNCLSCGDPEAIPHVLLHCSRYGDERLQLLKSLLNLDNRLVSVEKTFGFLGYSRRFG